MLIGIDIGTLRLRVNTVITEPITTDTSDTFATQLLVEVWNTIARWLPRLDASGAIGVAITATCLMVVQEVVQLGLEARLRPFNCLALPTNYKPSDNHDVLMWHDRRAAPQADKLNEVLYGLEILLRLGGRVTPELGIAKLRWLKDNYPDRRLVVFEYYDWITYLFRYGGYVRDRGMLTFPYVPFEADFADDSVAIDGLIKGWPREVWDQLGLSGSIILGGVGIDDGHLLPIGFPIGEVHPLILAMTDATSMTIAQGSIDVYGSWLLVFRPDLKNVTMIAGTSTCFILPLNTGHAKFISGIWGPYALTKSDKFWVYEFGQPCTGHLHERLIVDLLTILGNDSECDNPFDYLEYKTQQLEHKYDRRILEIIKSYMYYGDFLGNRSPYNLATMSEMLIDGKNSRPELTSAFTTTPELIVLRYNLTLEHLAFQTRQLLDIIQAELDIKLPGITVVGSQAQNHRFLHLVADVTGLNVVTTAASEGEFGGAEGAAIMAKVGRKLSYASRIDVETYSDSFVLSFPSNTGEIHIFHPNRNPTLEKKYLFYRKFASLQKQFKQTMG